ncbi:Carboxylesterase 1C [Pseudolycoriella hygida]|uniref:Carboxylic ester hydrolase n=1 Tax=Pseudolycoriella hygida TaxID=35572 RepID=A0A9Q0N0E7_9DIPT|nr:Carboxylesterase 1C [Pseudolycoriella hygida]
MDFHRVLLIVALTFTVVQWTACAIVTTPDGRIQGITMESRRNKTFHAFLKIPFAKPPIGELRFADPQPHEPWTEVLDGSEYGPACSQPAGLIPAGNIGEDCLHLNVFTENLPQNGSDYKPVIVYIHGGGFELGSAIISSPIVMMDRDIVFVTINYRMGIFGFIATGTEAAPGNAGLKDQIRALEWTKRNIEAFGGDSERITIWGMSAGAFSVTAMMASPLSSGLFHRVIAMSGTITSHRNLTSDSLETITELAVSLNCENANANRIVDCLRNKTEEELIFAQVSLPSEECPQLRWWPVVEKDFGQKRFLADQPTHLFKNGNFSKVPTLVGIINEEFAQLVPPILNSPLFMKELNDIFEDVAPRCFNYEEGTNISKAMSKHFRETYFPYEIIDDRSFEDLSNLFSDSIFGYPTHLFVNFASKFIDVYYYKFSYVGSHSLFLHPRNSPYSVAHGDDIHYLVPWMMFPIVGTDNPDNFLVERLLSIYENFAKNGDPNNSTDEHLSTMNWPAYDEKEAFYLDIGRHLVEKQGLYLNRYARWNVTLL